MKALSFKEPWAWAIFHGKPIDNRPRRTNYRGPLLIHVSQSFDWHGYEWIRKNCRNLGLDALPRYLFRRARGRIIGRVKLIDCVESHPSPWFFGPYGYVLIDALEFDQSIPYRGWPGMFDVPDSVIKNIQLKIEN